MILTRTLQGHFKSLNDKEQSPGQSNHCIADQNTIVSSDVEEFNIPISEEEVVSQIKKMKNNKASGIDLIVNECLKNSSDSLIKLITKLFSVILDTGIIPTEWTIGIIRPIYKKKGSINDPDNYRGITLLSCIAGKLFTSIINERLSKFLNNNNLLGEEQAGFREKCSTIDHYIRITFSFRSVLSSFEGLYSSLKYQVTIHYLQTHTAYTMIHKFMRKYIYNI